jgi:hypothetical protein
MPSPGKATAPSSLRKIWYRLPYLSGRSLVELPRADILLPIEKNPMSDLVYCDCPAIYPCDGGFARALDWKQAQQVSPQLP